MGNYFVLSDSCCSAFVSLGEVVVVRVSVIK